VTPRARSCAAQEGSPPAEIEPPVGAGPRPEPRQSLGGPELPQAEPARDRRCRYLSRGPVLSQAEPGRGPAPSLAQPQQTLTIHGPAFGGKVQLPSSRASVECAPPGPRIPHPAGSKEITSAEALSTGSTPFSLMCGVGLVLGYAFLGACWLVMKTVGRVEQIARRCARPLCIAFLAFICS
jgi:hypothetical protein